MAGSKTVRGGAHEAKRLAQGGTVVESPADLKELVALISAARRRFVESPPEKNLAWLLTFLQMPIDHIRESSDRELRYATAGFAEAIGGADVMAVLDLPIDQMLAAVQEIRENLGKLAIGLPWEPMRLEIDARVEPDWSARGVGLTVRYASNDPLNAFRLACFRTIDAAGGCVRICARPSCGRLFVKERKMMFCSRRCSAGERMRRYKGAHQGQSTQSKKAARGGERRSAQKAGPQGMTSSGP